MSRPITTQDRKDMAEWMRHQHVAPTPITIDALIQLFRNMEGGNNGEDPSD